MIVINNTIKAKGLGSFFKLLGRIPPKTGKELAKIVLENPGRALKNTSNVATAAANQSPKAALSSLPEAVNFLPHRERGISRKICLVLYHLN